MNEGALGIAILIGVAVVAAAAAAVATITFQLIVRLQLGYLDPFFPIAIVVGGVFAFLVALVVGVVPAVRTRNKREGDGRS